MDFIPFNNSTSKRNTSSSPNNLKDNSQKNSQSTNMKKSLSFGSPAVLPAFGSPAVNFGAPAVQNSVFNTQSRTPSPRHYSQQYSPRTHGQNMSPSPRPFHHQGQNMSPRPFHHHGQNMSPSPRAFHHHSPRSQNPHQFSPFGNRDNFKQSNDSFRHDGSGFKTPHQFSPNRGRGNGRKSFTRQFGQTPGRFDCNAGGSLNIEDYYHPSMIEDPWRNQYPVFIKV